MGSLPGCLLLAENGWRGAADGGVGVGVCGGGVRTAAAGSPIASGDELGASAEAWDGSWE
jgi:hypothetical protein